MTGGPGVNIRNSPTQSWPSGWMNVDTDTTTLSHSNTARNRELTELEFWEVLFDIRREPTRGLEQLAGITGGTDRTLCEKRLDLEFAVISPLYYRLQRHLIDWGTRSHYPEFSHSELAKFLDKRRFK